MPECFYLKTMKKLPPIDDELLHGRGLVALSGGADSVALLRLLHARGTAFGALHCNFHLRGAESDRDEAFVRQLCQRLDIPLTVKHFDTLSFAREQKISVEMAARRLRYDWFDAELHRTDAHWVAVAHHREDQAETILLNLLRGTGPAGLGGMRPRNGHIVRPLLEWHKQDILNYLAEIGQDFVTDSTNLEREAQRNILRLDVMPLLRQLNPQAVEHICRAGELVRSMTDGYAKAETRTGNAEQTGADEQETAAGRQGIAAERQEMTLYELHEWLHPLGFTLSQERDIHRRQQGESGSIWLSPTHRALRDRGRLIVEPRPQTGTDLLQNVNVGTHGSCVRLQGVGCHDGRTIRASLLRGCGSDSAMPVVSQEIIEVEDALAWLKNQPKDATIAYLDADLLTLPLGQRFVKTADRFHPFGMKGTKLVSDVLTNLKFSRFRKERQTVMTSGGEICWLTGLRSDHRFRITERTRRVMVLKVTIRDEKPTE